MSSLSPIAVGSAKDIVIREYTTSATWVKPVGLKYALIVCVGAGGGDGSGRRGNAGIAVTGQYEDTLTLACVTTPTVDIYFTLVIL